MLPFRFDFSRLSYTTVWDLIASILPGGVIALGWLYGHGWVWGYLREERTLKLGLAAFAIYVIGFIAMYLSALELGLVALVVLLRKTELSEPWKNIEWRRLASRFLGPELSPPVEEPSPALLSNEPPSATAAENLSKKLRENVVRRMEPIDFQFRWQKWYDILKARFPVSTRRQPVLGTVYFSVLNSVGLAGLMAAYISSRHVGWLVWMTCVLLIAVSHVSFTISFSQEQNPDPSGDQLAAEMLKAIKKQTLNGQDTL
jgi:hypothetical protein